MLKISTSWSSLFSFQCSDFGFTAYVTEYYYYHVWWCTTLFSLFLLLCPCMAINVSVQYNGGLLPDIVLLTQCYYHRGTRLNAMKRFCICSPWSHLNVLIFFPLTGGCSEGLGAFWFFFKHAVSPPSRRDVFGESWNPPTGCDMKDAFLIAVLSGSLSAVMYQSNSSDGSWTCNSTLSRFLSRRYNSFVGSRASYPPPPPSDSFFLLLPPHPLDLISPYDATGTFRHHISQAMLSLNCCLYVLTLYIAYCSLFYHALVVYRLDWTINTHPLVEYFVWYKCMPPIRFVACFV